MKNFIKVGSSPSLQHSCNHSVGISFFATCCIPNFFAYISYVVLDPFDILVNSAGIAKHSLSVETKEADFDDVMIVNLKGAYFLTMAVARRLMSANKSGSLINI